MKNNSLIFLILSFIMYSISCFWGDVLNNLHIGANTRFYHYSDTIDYSFLKNIPVEHLKFLNIFFAILFAVFLTLSIFMSIKEKRSNKYFGKVCRTQFIAPYIVFILNLILIL